MSRSGQTPSLTLIASTALIVVLLSVGCERRTSGPDHPSATWLGTEQLSAFSPRASRLVDLIVIYTTEHPAEHASELWRSSNVAGHYLITATGEVRQFVREKNVAFHAGNRAYNERSIAIAVEGYANCNVAESPSEACGWQTEEQFESLVALTSSVAGRHGIPLNREHIIGKNQVPGIEHPLERYAGPRNWGGATNKAAPGPGFNWTKLMKALGRESEVRLLEAVTRDEITTLTIRGSPVIADIRAGDRMVAYDETDSHYLVYFVGVCVQQPFLPVGNYHWDGWVAKHAVKPIRDGTFLLCDSGGPHRVGLYKDVVTVPKKVADYYVEGGKYVASTGRRARNAAGTWDEVYVIGCARDNRAWLFSHAD